jgi:iron complex transport system substrate-binding protein
MSNPSLEAVVSLKPDLVVMTTDGNPREVEERLRSLKIKTYVFRARMLHELPGGIRELGSAVGTENRADVLADDIENSIRKAAEKKKTSLVYRPSQRKKVLFIVWPEPLIVAGPGTAINDAIVLLGLENAAARAKTAYPRYSIEELIHQAPDVLYIGKATGMDMSAVSQGILKKLSSIPAVRNGAVCYVGDDLYRLGPRMIKGIEELANAYGKDCGIYRRRVWCSSSRCSSGRVINPLGMTDMGRVSG